MLVVDAEARPNLLAIDELAVDVLAYGESCELRSQYASSWTGAGETAEMRLEVLQGQESRSNVLILGKQIIDAKFRLRVPVRRFGLASHVAHPCFELSKFAAQSRSLKHLFRCQFLSRDAFSCLWNVEEFPFSRSRSEFVEVRDVE